MEASKFFGGSMPPAFKFDPTDADIVAHYLLPRALNLPNQYEHAVVEDDPASAPPWEILRRLGNLDHAFFFGPPADPSVNAGRKKRTVPGGGVWQGQNSAEDTVTLLRPGGGEVDIRFKRYDLTFSPAKGERSTGYVMHEYEIVSPPLPGTVLTRIRVPKAKKAANRLPPAPAAANQIIPDPEQPGPIYDHDAVLAGEGFGGAEGDPYGGGMIEIKNACYYSTPIQYGYELPSVECDNNCVSIPDLQGASYNCDAATMNGKGFTAAQADAFHGGAMLENVGAYIDLPDYVPESDYSNYYGVYEQWQCQQDRSNQYQAGHAGGGEVLSCEQQAGGLCGNSDSGETSTHSTISHCGDGEVDFDDISFCNTRVVRRRLQL